MELVRIAFQACFRRERKEDTHAHGKGEDCTEFMGGRATMIFGISRINVTAAPSRTIVQTRSAFSGASRQRRVPLECHLLASSGES